MNGRIRTAFYVYICIIIIINAIIVEKPNDVCIVAVQLIENLNQQTAAHMAEILLEADT